jgi:hypothetical protein
VAQMRGTIRPEHNTYTRLRWPATRAQRALDPRLTPRTGRAASTAASARVCRSPGKSRS